MLRQFRAYPQSLSPLSRDIKTADRDLFLDTDFGNKIVHEQTITRLWQMLHRFGKRQCHSLAVFLLAKISCQVVHCLGTGRPAIISHQHAGYELVFLAHLLVAEGQLVLGVPYLLIPTASLDAFFVPVDSHFRLTGVRKSIS